MSGRKKCTGDRKSNLPRVSRFDRARCVLPQGARLLFEMYLFGTPPFPEVPRRSGTSVRGRPAALQKSGQRHRRTDREVRRLRILDRHTRGPTRPRGVVVSGGDGDLRRDRLPPTHAAEGHRDARGAEHAAPFRSHVRGHRPGPGEDGPPDRGGGGPPRTGVDLRPRARGGAGSVRTAPRRLRSRAPPAREDDRVGDRAGGTSGVFAFRVRPLHQ
mmetsp:Transcript_23834/g.47376  ORF Transcript_23834/g.47376 Transcript_23834/m.47376 type:complete len:215 (+) Transcript_23834:69-713(+)